MPRGGDVNCLRTYAIEIARYYRVLRERGPGATTTGYAL
jgi:hypothetical protein